MVIRLGNNSEPDRLYLGNSAVSKIYLGNNQVWPVSSAVSSLALPLIAGPQQDGDTATVDTSALTDVSSIQWRVLGGGNLGTGATQDLTGLAGSRVEVVTTSSEGTLTSPALLVHEIMTGGATLPELAEQDAHNAMDAAVVALSPHNTVDKIAITSGDWSNPATWTGGAAPVSGERVLIPHGISVRYNVDAPATLIQQLRVDGTLTFATDIDTHMYVRDIVGDRMSTIAVGNSLADRITANATVTFEGQSSLDLVTDPELFGRGLVTLGRLDVFGKDMLNHSRAAFGVPAGATSIVLEKEPVGWGAGDQIVIGATSIQMIEGVGLGLPDIVEDEIVTIASVSGNTVNFTSALVNAHDNQNSNVLRTDIRPMVQLRAQSRNVIFKSEVSTPVTQRGHVMAMHHHARMDVWDLGIIDMGRADKTRPVGQKSKTGDFEYLDSAGLKLSTAMTADANIRGRYPIHGHLLGYEHLLAGRPMPILVGVSVEDTPGWGIVHHDCEMEIRHCSAFRFQGCGVVAEQGGELGVWNDLSSMQGLAVNVGSAVFLVGSVKGMEGSSGVNGDYFKAGIGFGYRGRSIKATDCIATSCARGHEFWHRGQGDASKTLFLSTSPPRNRMDLKEAGIMASPFAADVDEWQLANYPIVHFTDCGSIGCLKGFGVTKQTPQQNHDFNVILKRFFSHGFRATGADIEYIGTYILQDFDLVAGPVNSVYGVGQTGLAIGGNTHQIAVTRLRVEGTRHAGLSIGGSIAPGLFNYPLRDPAFYFNDEFDATTDPRNIIIGPTLINCGWVNGTPFATSDFQGVKTFADVSFEQDDFDSSYINHTLTPTETLPDVVGTWTGADELNTITDPPTNAKGLKFGNHPSGVPLVKTWRDGPFPPMGSFWQETDDFDRANRQAGEKIIRFAERFGYYQFGGSDVLVQRDLISDIVTGRPAKATFLWEADNAITVPDAADNGPISISPAVTTTDTVVTVAPNGSVTFNALAGAGGGSGSFEIDPGDFVSPDYGDLSINYATGMVTYTPLKDVAGQSDFGYLFIRSVRDTGATKTETRTYGTKRVAFLITSSDVLLAPAVGTDFTVAAGAGVINFDLLQRPASGGRRILVTQYSTDSGVTWRRLCNGYPLTPIEVDVDSTGAALSAGTQPVRLRYQTDHEYGFSPETADITPV